jgi:hypothetical protein
MKSNVWENRSIGGYDVPAGYILMPIIPTNKMIHAAREAAMTVEPDGECFGHPTIEADTLYRAWYAAMIRTAPEPEPAALPCAGTNSEDAARIDALAEIVSRPLPPHEAGTMIRYIQVEMHPKTLMQNALFRVLCDGHSYGGNTLRAAIDAAVKASPEIPCE